MTDNFGLLEVKSSGDYRSCPVAPVEHLQPVYIRLARPTIVLTRTRTNIMVSIDFGSISLKYGTGTL
jgi:ABC-type transport system involved in cytochrome bd biosynthesis fused ATPase/permease subunit